MDVADSVVSDRLDRHCPGRYFYRSFRILPEIARSGTAAADAADPKEGFAKILAIVKRRIPKRFGLDQVRDVQLLCPMHRGGLRPAHSISSCRRRSARRAR